MKLYPGIICLGLLGSNVCQGQDSTDSALVFSSHVLGGTIGLNQVKEENILPRAHTGFIAGLSYEYRRMGGEYQDVRFALGISRVVATPEDITKSGNVMMTSSYSYCFKVIEEPSFRYLVGPQAKLAYSISYYPNWDDSHLYWASSLSLGISSAAFYTFENRTQLFSRFSFALLSLYSRPDALRLYKIDDMSFDGIVRNVHRDLELGLLDMVTSVHFEIEYQFPVLQTKTEAVFYSVDYARIRKGNALPFAQLFHQLGVRILL